jgi:hypothetical protein
VSSIVLTADEFHDLVKLLDSVRAAREHQAPNGPRTRQIRALVNKVRPLDAGMSVELGPPRAAPVELGPRVSFAAPTPKGMFDHTFQLRADLQILVRLPDDLTRKDVHRMERWLRLIPYEEEAPIGPPVVDEGAV